jgi:hypothetical protein
MAAETTPTEARIGPIGMCSTEMIMRRAISVIATEAAESNTAPSARVR